MDWADGVSFREAIWHLEYTSSLPPLNDNALTEKKALACNDNESAIVIPESIGEERVYTQ